MDQMLGVLGWLLIVGMFCAIAIPAYRLSRKVLQAKKEPVKPASFATHTAQVFAPPPYVGTYRSRYTPPSPAVAPAKSSDDNGLLTGLAIGGLATYAMTHSDSARAAPAFSGGGGDYGGAGASSSWSSSDSCSSSYDSSSSSSSSCDSGSSGGGSTD